MRKAAIVLLFFRSQSWNYRLSLVCEIAESFCFFFSRPIWSGSHCSYVYGKQKSVNGKDLGMRKKKSCAVGWWHSIGTRDLHFNTVPSSKTSFEAKERCSCLQTVKWTDWSANGVGLHMRRNAKQHTSIVSTNHQNKTFSSLQVFSTVYHTQRQKAWFNNAKLLTAVTMKLPFSVGILMVNPTDRR